MPLTIRPAARADVPHLVDWNAAMAQETEAKWLDRHVLARGVEGVFDDPRRGFYLVAEREGVAVGSLMVTFEWSDWRCGDFWWIQSVYVRPEYRRRGVYRRMYAYLRKLAANDRAVVGFRLYVERNNRRAQSTYRASGMGRTHYLVYEHLKPGIRFFTPARRRR